jgi:16S rRNA (cytosine967-C5)-methyltransferase
MQYLTKNNADKVVARALKDKRWGSSDGKFMSETIYEVK